MSTLLILSLVIVLVVKPKIGSVTFGALQQEQLQEIILKVLTYQKI